MSITAGRAGQVRRWAPVAVLVVAVVSLMGWMASLSDDDAPAADDPTTEIDAADVAPVDVPPPDPVEEPEPDEPAAEEEPVSPPEGFRDATGTVLLFDVGSGGSLAVDLDSWEQQRVGLPGHRPGDQPFRLWRMGSEVVVGWERIWSVAPDRPELARSLGEATVFLPHAEPDALWLIDYEGGRIGTGTSTWTLIDPSGTELAEVSSMPAGLLPVRGVPGGLAVHTPEGTMVYDLAQDRLVESPAGRDTRVADVTRERVAWCDGDPCEQLLLTDQDGATVATVGSGETFEPSQVWLSPSGDRLAAGVRVQVGEGVDLRLRIYRTDDGVHLADTQLALGDLYGAWTADGDQFYAWNHFPDHGPPAPANLHRWAGRDDIEQVELGEHGIRNVYDFVTFPSTALEGLFAPSP